MVSKELLGILACPVCKAGVRLKGDDRLVCIKCKREYPVEDGIPNMLPVEKA
jgi:hypothetical protein